MEPLHDLAVDQSGDAGYHYLRQELYELVKKDSTIFEFIQDGALDGVWYWDLQSPDNEWMSPRFWRILGYDPDAMEHKASEWQHIIAEEDLKLAMENFEAHCADPNHTYDQIVRYHHRNGSTVWVRCRGLAIRDDDGKPVRMLGAHTDITELKQAEQEVQRANKRLLDTNRDLSQFTYSASHDLQAPVRTIKTLLGVLESEHASTMSKDGRTLVDMAIQTADRAQNILDDLLAISMINDGFEKPQSVDLGAVLEEVTTVLKNNMDITGIRIDIGAMPTVTGSKRDIVQVLQNLIGNSLKFRNPNRAKNEHVVTILATEREDSWVLSVSDNGIGISMEDKEKLFTPFVRLHTYDEYPGTGLGLSICRRTIEKHGGDIWLESVLGEGTTVSITFAKNA